MKPATFQDRAMLVNLYIAAWTALTTDRTVTAEIATSKEASKSAGRYMKKLMPPNAISFEKVWKIINEARIYNRLQTLPWANDNGRIMPNEHYLTYAEGMRQRRSEFKAAVPRFIDDYPALKKRAAEHYTALGYLYREEDYPTQDELWNKFEFEVTVFPIPSAGDFRLTTMDEALREAVKEAAAQCDMKVQEAFAASNRELYERLSDAIGKMVERLKCPKAIFRDTLVTNLQEVIDLIPRLNVTNDTELEALRKEAAVLVAHEPSELREDLEVRKKVAKKAGCLHKKMEQYMQAFATMSKE